MHFFYRFPKIESQGHSKQLRKIGEELSESVDAYVDWCTTSLGHYLGKETDEKLAESRQQFGIEVLDIIHACETLLRSEFTDVEAVTLRLMCEKKNRDRGYYDVTDFEEEQKEVAYAEKYAEDTVKWCM